MPTDGDALGDEWINGALVPLTAERLAEIAQARTAASAADMPDISDRQFARGLWGARIIDYDDFLGFIGPGKIPVPIQTIVDQLPDDDTGAPTPRKDAVGFLTGSKLYSFNHGLVEFFRQALSRSDDKWTPEYLRARWMEWSTL